MYFYQMLDEMAAQALGDDEPGLELRQQSIRKLISLNSYIERHRPEGLAMLGLAEAPGETITFFQGIALGMVGVMSLFSDHGLPEDLAEVLDTKVS